MLIESFARFLFLNNGFGQVVVEASSDNEKLIEEFYRLKLVGSQHITREGYQSVLRSITFETKDRLNAGLQMADIIANAVSRLVCNLKHYCPIGYSESPFPAIILNKAYKGNSGDIYEYGIKKLYI